MVMPLLSGIRQAVIMILFPRCAERPVVSISNMHGFSPP